MSLEDLLRTSASDIADHVVPTGPDVDALRRAGRRTKRRRTATAAAVVSLVVGAGAVLTATQLDRADPQPVDEPPVERSDAVWWDGEQFRVGDEVLRVPPEELHSALEGVGTVRDGLVYGFGRVTYHPFDGPPREVSRMRPEWGPIGDADGDNAAWIEATASGSEIVVLDTRRDVELARVSIAHDEDAAFEGGDPPILFVDADRVVYVSNGKVFTKWFHDSSPPEWFRYTPEELIDVSDDMEVVAGEPIRDADTGAFSLTTMTFRNPSTPDRAPRYRRPVWDEGLLSDNGRWMATMTGYQDGMRLVVIDTRTGRRTGLDMPVAWMPRPYGWAYGDTLMVLHFDRREKDPIKATTLMACDVSEEICQEEPEGTMTFLVNNPFG